MYYGNHNRKKINSMLMAVALFFAIVFALVSNAESREMNMNDCRYIHEVAKDAVDARLDGWTLGDYLMFIPYITHEDLIEFEQSVAVEVWGEDVNELDLLPQKVIEHCVRRLQ